MDWKQLLSEMNISSSTGINEGLVALAMYLDLYKMTKNEDLKAEIEFFIYNMLKASNDVNRFLGK